MILFIERLYVNFLSLESNCVLLLIKSLFLDYFLNLNFEISLLNLSILSYYLFLWKRQLFCIDLMMNLYLLVLHPRFGFGRQLLLGIIVKLLLRIIHFFKLKLLFLEKIKTNQMIMLMEKIFYYLNQNYYLLWIQYACFIYL